MKRVYLRVMAYMEPSGRMLPRKFQWIDGNAYTIERVIDIRPAGSLKASAAGDRYTVSIQGRIQYIYFEHSADLSGNRLGRRYMDIPA